MPRTKVQCFKYFFCILASKDIFTPANSIKHMTSNFAHFQKRLEKKIKRSSCNAEKIASEKNVPSQKPKEDVFTPDRLEFQ